jgi:hypothetical protein
MIGHARRTPFSIRTDDGSSRALYDGEVRSCVQVLVAVTVAACSFSGRGSGDLDAPGDDAIDAPVSADAAVDGSVGMTDAVADANVDAMVDAAPTACTTAGLVCPGTTPILLACGTSCWAGCTNGSPITQSSAGTRCAAWGGELARIDSAGENACVQSALNGAVWLGLVQAPGEGADDVGWSWNADGAPLAFVNWDVGQPDDDGGGENDAEQCAYQQATTGDWHDTSCATSFARFACRRP